MPRGKAGGIHGPCSGEMDAPHGGSRPACTLPVYRYERAGIMERDRFIQLSARYRNLLQEQENIRQDIAEFEGEFKQSAGLTNPQVATTKRIIKADIKGALDKLVEKMGADQELLAILTHEPQKKSSQKLSSIPHDPETGEIIDAADAQEATAAVAPEGVPSSTVTPPQDEAKVRDSLSKHTRDTRTPNEIIGDDPIPHFLDRRAEA